MRPVEGGLEIKPGETIELKPGSLHAMLVGLKQPLQKGQTVKGTLEFEKAGKVDIEYAVEALGATAPAAGGHHDWELCPGRDRARRALRAMVAAAINPMAASGRPMYQRSRSRPRVRR